MRRDEFHRLIAILGLWVCAATSSVRADGALDGGAGAHGLALLRDEQLPGCAAATNVRDLEAAPGSPDFAPLSVSGPSQNCWDHFPQDCCEIFEALVTPIVCPNDGPCAWSIVDGTSFRGITPIGPGASGWTEDRIYADPLFGGRCRYYATYCDSAGYCQTGVTILTFPCPNLEFDGAKNCFGA